MNDFPATESGAQREKLDVPPYDLVPYQEITDAFARVAEHGARKYTSYWGCEWEGLLNVRNVAKIEITLPATCVERVISRLGGPLDTREKFVPSGTAPSAEKPEKYTSPELVSVVLVTTSGSKQPILSITSVKNKTPDNTIGETKITGLSNVEIGNLIQFLESVIGEQSFSHISEALESRSRNISLTDISDAQSAEPLLTFTLTMTTGQVFSEVFFVRAATTVSAFWATISQALRRRSLICEIDVRVRQTGCWNWSKGLPRVQILGSILRHTFAYLRGQDRDPDSGLLHTDHILWNAAALSHNVHWNLADGRRAEPPRAYKGEAVE